jgi:lipooligosaccharide transport system permease protein
MSTPIRPTTLAVASGRLAPGPRPPMTRGERMLAVTGHHLLVYRRTWRATIIERFLAPFLFLLSVGLGVGGLVDDGAGGIGGVPYLQYVAPGLVTMQAMWLAFGESTYVVMGYLKWNEMYAAMLASPLVVVEVLGGHLLVVAAHLLGATTIFVAVGSLLGAFASWWAVAMVPLAALTGMAVSMPLFALAATTRDDSGFGVVNRLVLAPLLMVSGVFFPVDSLPVVLQPVAWLSPLFHGTELCRDAAVGSTSVAEAAPHVLVLAAWLVGGWLLARRQFTRRLMS